MGLSREKGLRLGMKLEKIEKDKRKEELKQLKKVIDEIKVKIARRERVNQMLMSKLEETKERSRGG